MQAEDKDYYRHIVCVTNFPNPLANPKEVTPDNVDAPKDLGWYFYDEAYDTHGPFGTLDETIRNFKKYCEQM